MSDGRADFEFFVRGVGLEEAEESLLAFTAGWNSRFHIPSSAFIAPLPPLKNALSADETAKLRALDSRIRDPFVENWAYGLKIHAPDPSDPTAAWPLPTQRHSWRENGGVRRATQEGAYGSPRKLPRLRR